MKPLLTFVVAVARNGVIGKGGVMPWRLSSEIRAFKRATMGKPVLMGRKTWESLQTHPLPGRANIIISRNADFRPKGAWAYADLEVALAAAAAMTDDEICVIGGATLYETLLPRADRILLTDIDLAPNGDAHFPALDPAQWEEVAREDFPPGPKDDAAYSVRDLRRRR